MRADVNRCDADAVDGGPPGKAVPRIASAQQVLLVGDGDFAWAGGVVREGFYARAMNFARIIRRQVPRTGGSGEANGNAVSPAASPERGDGRNWLRSRLRPTPGAMAPRGATLASGMRPDAHANANAGDSDDLLGGVDPDADPRGLVPAYTEIAGPGETMRTRPRATPTWDRTGGESRTSMVAPTEDTPRVIDRPMFGKDRRCPEQLADWALLDGARRLSYAAIYGAIRAKACLEVRSPFGRQTALHKVFKQTRPETDQQWTSLVAIVRLLLDEGSGLNDGDARGVTPLYQAVRMGYLDRPEIKSLVMRTYSEEEIDQHCEHVQSLLAEWWSPEAP
jgi:hypothetical protein